VHNIEDCRPLPTLGVDLPNHAAVSVIAEWFDLNVREKQRVTAGAGSNAGLFAMTLSSLYALRFVAVVQSA
jgi:hypothetical protein